ncbi:MAG: ABC-2 family transporter protein [Fusobacteriales bacterium]|jgi:ABC-2 type transport system permease protein|nr:ABC-2 family transporter protein [Fusobacteriales bacterium]
MNNKITEKKENRFLLINKFIYEIKKYCEVAKINFKNCIIWRFDILANLLLTVTKITFAYILWKAAFGENDVIGGFSFYSMLTYYVTGAFLSGADMSKKISTEICARVISGTFSKYIIIPVNIQVYFMAQSFGRLIFYLLLNIISLFTWLFIFQISFSFTNNMYYLGIAAVMALLGLIFMTEFQFFIGILSFKFLEITMFRIIVDNITVFITGAAIPLSLLPGAVTAVMRIFPFYYIIYLPSMLAVGRNENEALSGLIIIFAWVLAFFIINNLLYKRLRVLFEGVGI